MNLDDPKLTAYALDELEESERSNVARAVGESAEAQQFVAEARELAQALKNEFRNELRREPALPLSIMDIHDDPWFWTRVRPLGIAAALVILAIIGVIVGSGYRSRLAESSKVSPPPLVDFEVNANSEAPFAGPDRIPNPWPQDSIKNIEQVVIGQIEPGSSTELRVIEIITDSYRLQRLQNRLATSELSRRSDDRNLSRDYKLVLLDRNGRILAGVTFHRVPETGFVLQPIRNACERNGRYFLGGCAVDLPGDWRSDINYQRYIIPFPDWVDCIGYTPGA
jgi:hypothetical protein